MKFFSSSSFPVISLIFVYCVDMNISWICSLSLRISLLPPLLLSSFVLISYSLCSLHLPLSWCQNTTKAIELGSNCNNLKVLSSIVHVIHCWLRALNECDAQKQHSSSYSELLAKLIVLSVRLPNSIRFSNESLNCVCTHIRTTLGLHTRQNVSSYCCRISFNLNVSNSDKNCGDDDMLSKIWFG